MASCAVPFYDLSRLSCWKEFLTKRGVDSKNALKLHEPRGNWTNDWAWCDMPFVALTSESVGLVGWGSGPLILAQRQAGGIWCRVAIEISSTRGGRRREVIILEPAILVLRCSFQLQFPKCESTKLRRVAQTLAQPNKYMSEKCRSKLFGIFKQQTPHC